MVLAESEKDISGGLTPLYYMTELMKKAFLHSRAIQDMQYTLLSTLDWQIPETLPESIVTHFQMMSVSEAIKNIHFPESAQALQAAQQRLKFDELFYIQLNILRTATLRRNKLSGVAFRRVGDAFHTFYRDYLPFRSTSNPSRGEIISSTSDVTMAVKAAPMMIPTAISITLPFIAKSLNSSKNFLILHSLLI